MCRKTRQNGRHAIGTDRGITTLKYIGASLASENGGYQGDTGRTYNFGIDAPQGVIDKRDLPYFTALTEDGIQVFKEVR
jgi:hypothetical protein